MDNSNRFEQIEITSDYTLAKNVEDQLVSQAQAYHYDEDVVFALRLSLEEALSNAIRHGNKGNANKKVKIRYLINSDIIDIYVEDQGEGFNPTDVPDPTSQENLSVPSGRGIMLMRAYMNKVEYNATGNVIHLVKLNQAS